MTRLTANLIIYFLSIFFSTIATAGELKLSLGTFYTNQDSGFGVNGRDSERDVYLDFESHLELEENTSMPFAEVQYWFNNRHAVFADYRHLDRESSRVRNHRVNRVDNTYIESDLSSSFQLSMIRVGYGYNFFSNEDLDVGILLGVHMLDLEFSIDGELKGCFEGDCESSKEYYEGVYKEGLIVPLPDIGIALAYQISDSWQLRTYIQYFQVRLDEGKGHFIDSKLGFEWQFTDHFLVDLSYKFYDIHVDVDTTEAHYSAHYNFSGPSLGVSLAF